MSWLTTVAVGREYFGHCQHPTRAALRACHRHGIPSRCHGARQFVWSRVACERVFRGFERVAA